MKKFGSSCTHWQRSGLGLGHLHAAASAGPAVSTAAAAAFLMFAVVNSLSHNGKENHSHKKSNYKGWNHPRTTFLRFLIRKLGKEFLFALGAARWRSGCGNSSLAFACFPRVFVLGLPPLPQARRRLVLPGSPGTSFRAWGRSLALGLWERLPRVRVSVSYTHLTLPTKLEV